MMNFNRRLHDIAALRKDLGFGCCRDTDLISEARAKETAVLSFFFRAHHTSCVFRMFLWDCSSPRLQKERKETTSGSPERSRLQYVAVTQILSWKTGGRRAQFFLCFRVHHILALRKDLGFRVLP